MVLFGAECLILAPDAEARLNRVQQDWALKIIGCNRLSKVRGVLAVAQRGWSMRLGTRMIESVMVARARLAILPQEHPAVVLMRIAERSHAITWCTKFRQVANGNALPRHIPDIESCEGFPPEALQEARQCSQARRFLLRRYRWSVVRHTLIEYDQAAFIKAGQKFLPGLQCYHGDLQPVPMRLAVGLLELDISPGSWRWFRAWAVIRLTGCWPCPLDNGGPVEETFEKCALCGKANVGVEHAIARSPRDEISSLAMAIFGVDASVHHRLFHIRFVGKCISPHFCHYASNQLEDDDIWADIEMRLGHLMRNVFDDVP